MTARSRDYPRGAAPALLAAILAGALGPAFAASPPDSSCPVPFFHPAKTDFVPPPSPEACASAQSYLAPFKSLLRAADFAEGAISLWGRVDPTENAAFFRAVDVVMVNTGTMAKHPKPNSAMLFVLAHEIGHAVQKRNGELAWKDKGEDEEFLRRSRIVEGQADHIARELLTRAGLGGARATMQGVEQFFSCERIQDGAEAATSHPAAKDRFLQQLKTGSLARKPQGPLDELSLAEAFDRAGRRSGDAAAPAAGPARGPQVYRPSLGVDDFDAYGRPKNEGLRTRAVPSAAARAHEPSAAPGFWENMRRSAGAAWDAVQDRLWFDHPIVETAALKSCGLAKDADFNQAVAVGSWAWARETAAEWTNRLRGAAR